MVTILVVEDDASILQVTRAILEYGGYMVVTADNGQEAFDYLEQGNLPDMVLSDVMMPVMDGAELCRRIQASPAYDSLPIVLASAARSAHSLEECRYSAFLAKPFDATELLTLMANVLGERQIS
jgi:CheY-like chemotaxis protein